MWRTVADETPSPAARARRDEGTGSPEAMYAGTGVGSLRGRPLTVYEVRYASGSTTDPVRARDRCPGGRARHLDGTAVSESLPHRRRLGAAAKRPADGRGRQGGRRS